MTRTRTPGVAVALDRIPPGSQVLDAACGTGVDIATLERRGHRVVGADASEAMLRKARERTGADLVRCTWAELPEHVAGPFDAVLCLGNSLPHCRSSAERRAALASFASLLAPGGVVIVDSHDWEVVHAEGSGARGPFEWRVAERLGDPYVLAITVTDGDRTTVHEVVSHPFTRAQLLDEVAAAGMVVEDVVTVRGDDRYTVVATC